MNRNSTRTASAEAFDRRRLLHLGAAAVAAGFFPWRKSLAIAADEDSLQQKLKITAVTTFHLRRKLKRPFGVSVSVPLDATRETLLVKIETDAGLVGWGETAPIAGARGTIEDQMKPQLLGRNPLEYRKLWRELWGANFGNGLALGAVETALNDLRGKALNMPVAELFGGRLRDRTPVYASAMNYVEGGVIEDEYPAAAAELVERGYKAMKMRLGRYSVAREAAVAAKVREAVGPNVRLMVDGNAAYTLGSALKMGHALHELGFDFFEEPLPQSPRYAGYEELCRKLPLPLAGGEAVDSRAAAKDLIDRRTMNIIQPDLSLCGGLCEALAIAEMAGLSGIGCIPHCWGGDILIAASIHLLSLIPDPHWGLPTDTPLLEIDQSENPWRNGLARERFEIVDGAVAVPTRPGLGIEVDEDLVRRDAI